MRWRGTAVVVMLLLATTLCVDSTPVGAAPMTGVVFNDALRVFDQFDVPAGTTTIAVPTPTGATQALVHFTVVGPAPPSTGALMAHDCAVAANPLTDVVLPIQDGPVLSNFVYMPVSAGTVCVTTTVTTPRLIADLEASVVPSGGAAYVDLPFSYVTTVVGPVGNAPIDLSAFGVPSNATGVAVWLDASSSSSAGYATLHPCDQPTPIRSDVSFALGAPATAVVAGTPTDASGLCITSPYPASIDISIDGYYAVGASPTATSPPQVRYVEERAPGFVGTSPTRLFDTRTAGIPIIGGQVYRLDLSPYVPTDTSSVVMNVTVTEPTASGFITVYPCDGEQPLASNLNFVAGQTVPNLVTVDAGVTLEVCFFANTTTHLLADLSGYYRFGAGDGFTPAPPVRMFDTRGSTKLAAGSVFEFDLSPFVAADASSAVFNLTATEVDGPGFITAYPCGPSRPLASNLNVSRGQTVPNLVTVALPPNKHVCFFTVAPTHLLADLAGWYSPSATSGFVSITPTRWIDTRDVSATPVPAGADIGIPFGLDFPDATAMLFNATATEPQYAGYLTAYPCGPAVPTASNLDFVATQTVPNMVISAVDGSGEVCIFNSAPVHWIIDVGGYFTDSQLFFAFFPDGTDIS